jgi:S1-C subfamily serine protease
MRLAVALGVLALAAGGCASAAPALQAPDRTELIGRILASTVQLRSERQGGIQRAASGVVVALDARLKRAWIVTARHFVDPSVSQRIFVRVAGSTTVLEATVALVSRNHDLAVITTEPIDASPARLKEAASLGDEILVVAFPWGQRVTVVAGIVSQIAGLVGQIALTGPPGLVDASVSYGSSGGGVFDIRSGELIGIVEGHRTAKVAIPTMEERSLQLPVAGETSVIATATILRELADSDVRQFLPR